MEIQHYIEALTKIDNAIAQVIGALQGELTKQGGESSKTSAFYPTPIKSKEDEIMPKLKNIYIYKKDKYYVGVVAYDGKRKSFTRKSKTELIAAAKECLQEFKETADPVKRQYLDTIARFYLENLKKPFISETYYNSLVKHYNKHVKPKIGNYRIASLTPIILQKYFEELTEYSTRVAEDVKTLLNQIFEYSVGNAFIKVNPMRAVKVKRHERINGNALKPEQITTLKNAIENTKYKIPFLILLYTGVRGSEYHSLEFNFDNNTVKIKNSKLKQHQKEKFRTIPILTPLLPFKNDILNGEWKKITINELERSYKEFAKLGRLNWLRHTFQTYCMIQAPNELVNYWSGHTLGKDMSSKVYLHYPLEYQQKIASSILY